MRFPFSKRARAPVILVLAGISAAGQTAGIFPYVQNTRPDGAAILWTTIDAPGAGSLQYAPDGSFSLSAPSSVRRFPADETGLPYEFWLHRAELTGLTPDTEYAYRALVNGTNLTPAGDQRFRTTGAGAVRFLVFGDSGDGAPTQRSLAARMERENAGLILHTGDLAYENGTFGEFEDYFFSVYRRLASRAAFFPVAGNHDYGFRQAAAFQSLFSVPVRGVPREGRGLYYSFDAGPVHFIALDSNLPLIQAAGGDGEMLQWLEADLRSAGAQYRVAYFHHTPFPTGHHVGDANCALAQERITPILELHGVHLVLNGHEHVYQRTKPRRDGVFLDEGWGTVYVTTGGGGAALQPAGSAPPVAAGISASHYLRIDADSTRMRVQAIGADGRILDEFDLSPGLRIAPGGVRDAASFGADVAAGGLITVTGKDLARVWEASGPESPLRLGDVTVTASGTPIPLLFVSRRQINAQLPFDAGGRTALRVDGPNGAAQIEVFVKDTAPAIFSAGAWPAVIHQDGRLVQDNAPAAPGEWLALFATGLGKTFPPWTAGQPAPWYPLLAARAPVSVRVGGVEAEVGFAGLAPLLAGVNQVNFRVPPRAAGPQELSVQAGEAVSRPVRLAVR